MKVIEDCSVYNFINVVVFSTDRLKSTRNKSVMFGIVFISKGSESAIKVD